MTSDESQDRLSRIQTHWSRLLAPTDGPEKDLLLRYYSAAFRYLLAILHDATIAEELAQEFAVRFLAGHYSKVDRQRGRFRDFLKAALRNLIHDYWRRQQKERARTPADPDGFEPSAPEAEENAFDAGWRDEMLVRTWEALARFETDTGKPYFALLRVKTEEPTLRSDQLAQRLALAGNKTLTDQALRQTLHRARETFADLLLDEVQRTLTTIDRDQLEEELVELQLVDYCRKALDRRFPRP